MNMPDQRMMKTLVDRVLDVFLATSGPLGTHEIAELSGISEKDLKAWAGDQDVYTWLLSVIVGVKFVEMDSQTRAMSGINESIRWMGSPSSARMFEVVIHLTRKLKEQTVGFDGHIGMREAELPTGLKSFETPLHHMKKVPRDQVLNTWTRFLAQLALIQSQLFHQYLIENTELPFTWAELQDHLAGE